jgi:hypothetical protein
MSACDQPHPIDNREELETIMNRQHRDHRGQSTLEWVIGAAIILGTLATAMV